MCSTPANDTERLEAEAVVVFVPLVSTERSDKFDGFVPRVLVPEAVEVPERMAVLLEALGVLPMRDCDEEYTTSEKWVVSLLLEGVLVCFVLGTTAVLAGKYLRTFMFSTSCFAKALNMWRQSPL
mmetsp:Transcript_68884/g.165345  ORF Transcript_68884/g.165345 Transcript_68884/m.165345 type:complete len:125 (+) Transcript_68884:332-706(+)|eukprot:CAMPEP_0178407850 /NCGR_PEP_ID=MMETSP0689_2-20121128/19638_1 /TAXON_ID=160604 /ORGANISM="Amphidinium massartii, Strain CS-259" /LENGTH=124 /DNA_ID=CAMNT_0020028931 /DNA_START=235 /DNA_END=609 /DNA_ORIENTATION=+